MCQSFEAEHYTEEEERQHAQEVLDGTISSLQLRS